MPTTDSNIDAMISLLDDQDEQVYHSVRAKLYSLGPALLPRLEEAIQSAVSLEQLKNLDELIGYFKRELILDQMKKWLADEKRTLQEGWILISSICHPNISREKIEHNIRKIQQEAWLEIADSMTSLEKVAVINHILFKANYFGLAGAESPSLENLVVDKLLFSKVGHVYSLSVLYLIIARNLNINLVPIMLANKLLLVYEDRLAASVAFGTDSEKFLFYINVGHRGSVISPKEVQFLYDRSAKYGSQISHIESDISLIKRILQLMYLILTSEGDEEKLLLAEAMLSLMEAK